MPSTLDDLIAQHQAAHTAYCKLYAASKAVAKRLEEARKVRKAIRQQIHPVVGVLQSGTLVMTLTGTRFYEVEDNPYRVEDRVEAGIFGYNMVPVYKHTGATKTVNSPTYGRTSRYIEAGSVRPVPVDHPVYTKWCKAKFRDKLEGKD